MKVGWKQLTMDQMNCMEGEEVSRESETPRAVAREGYLSVSVYSEH